MDERRARSRGREAWLASVGLEQTARNFRARAEGLAADRAVVVAARGELMPMPYELLPVEGLSLNEAV
jgi:hypothetical protein